MTTYILTKNGQLLSTSRKVFPGWGNLSDGGTMQLTTDDQLNAVLKADDVTAVWEEGALELLAVSVDYSPSESESSE